MTMVRLVAAVTQYDRKRPRLMVEDSGKDCEVRSTISGTACQAPSMKGVALEECPHLLLHLSLRSCRDGLFLAEDMLTAEE